MKPASKGLAKSFINSLKQLKKDAKAGKDEMSNAELARMLGLGASTVSGWFNRRAVPTTETIIESGKRLEAELKRLHALAAAVENAIPRPVTY